MAKKHTKKTRLTGVIIFSTPSTPAHNIVDNWIEHRIIEPEELQYRSVSKKDSKTVSGPREFGAAEAGSREPVMAASSLGLHL